MAGLADLSDKQQHAPEANAIRRFATRDYRPMLLPESGEPSDIESLALLWATQQCRRSDLLRDACVDLLQRTHSPAFSTLYNPADFSAPTEAISMALARDANDILCDDRIPAADRRDVGAALAKVLSAEDSPDPASLGRAIAWKVSEEGYRLQAQSGRELTDTMTDMTELYAVAMATPAGPVTHDQGIRWQCLCPHDFAELQRGLMLVTLFIQARSMGYCLGVPQEMHDLCEALANGLHRLKGIDAFFRGYGLIVVGRQDRAMDEARTFLHSSFGRTLWGRTLFVQSWYSSATPDWGKGTRELWPGRGAWEWCDCACSAMSDGSPRAADALAWRALSVDRYNGWPLPVLQWCRRTTLDIAEPFLARLPYNLAVLEDAAAAARNHAQPDKATGIYRQMIDLMPRDSTGYDHLAWQYARAGKYDEAIETVRLADKKCEFSICLSNLLGQGACWLVERDRPQEALEFGRKSARSYSGSGLRGLAVALAANNKIAEAEDVFRQIAFRYESGTVEYIRFLLQHGRDQAFVAEQIKALLKEHSQMRDSIAAHVGQACCQACVDPQVLEAFCAGPLQLLPKQAQQAMLLECAMYARDFPKAVEYGLALHEAKQLTIYSRVWLIEAMQLAGKTERLQEIEDRLPLYGHDMPIDKHVQYILGKFTWQQLLDSADSDYKRSVCLLAPRHRSGGQA